MSLLSGGNFTALYGFLSIFLISRVTSNGRTNRQQIEVRIKEVVPMFLFVPENSSTNIYCGSHSSAVNWAFATKYPWIVSFSRHLLSKHSKGFKQVTLNNLKKSDSGFYICRGTDTDEHFTIFSKVTVLGNFFAEIQKENNFGNISPNWVEVPRNGTVTLTCFSGSPVEWFSVHFNTQKKRHSRLHSHFI